MADKTLKINGREYVQSDLNDTARNLLRNIAITDEKIRNLQQELTLFKVAREAFGSALLAQLPDAQPAAAQQPGNNSATQGGTTLQ